MAGAKHKSLASCVSGRCSRVFNRLTCRQNSHLCGAIEQSQFYFTEVFFRLKVIDHRGPSMAIFEDPVVLGNTGLAVLEILAKLIDRATDWRAEPHACNDDSMAFHLIWFHGR